MPPVFTAHTGSRPVGPNRICRRNRPDEPDDVPDDDDVRPATLRQQHPHAQLRELAAWQERLANGQSGIDRHRKRVATVRHPGDVHLAVSIVETKRCAKERAAAHASVVHDVIAREYSDAHAWMDTWSQISPSLVPSDETEHWQRQAAERRANAAHVLAQRNAGRERRYRLGEHNDLTGKPHGDRAPLAPPAGGGSASWTPKMRSGEGDRSVSGIWAPREADPVRAAGYFDLSKWALLPHSESPTEMPRTKAYRPRTVYS